MRKVIGSLYTWGDAYHVKLGQLVTDPIYTPTKVTLESKSPTRLETTEHTQAYLRRNERPLKKKFLKVATGPFHTACISEDYKLYTFGEDDFSKLGHTFYYPQLLGLVPAFQSTIVVDVACGADFTVVSTDDGKVYTWGYGGMSRSLLRTIFHKVPSGALGHGDLFNYSKPTLVEGLGDIVQVAAGHHHTLALAGKGKARKRPSLHLGAQRPRTDWT